ncbi:MAG: M1 family metallopeptidase [Gemmatimonadetes bacterium]|nr:M1 family metallopeptidase [Gemmatimonadota bacterium]
MKQIVRVAVILLSLVAVGTMIGMVAPDERVAAIGLVSPGHVLAQAPPDSTENTADDLDSRAADDLDSSTPDDSASEAVGMFAPLDLHPPDEYRTAAGAPGAAYWQQRVDYRVEATLDADAHRVTGSETITYTNNSPDSLFSIWLQLDQNLFQPDSRGAVHAAEKEDARFRGAFEGGGYDIGRVAVIRDGVPLEVPESHAAAGGSAGEMTVSGLAYSIDGTMMEISLDRAIAPVGGQIEIQLEYAFTVPETGADRMGRVKAKKGTVYELAQWYPRAFVYDDVNGWNVMPYLGQGEFYLEYGDFDVEITVPREFIVVATGELQNEQEVLTQEQQERLALARRSPTRVFIVEKDEVGKEESRPPGDGPITWKFRAENVRDFAWATSRAFIWDAASWDGVLAMSAYPQEGISQEREPPGWEKATEYVVHALQHYSGKWQPYPYPVAINVAGTALGMEYPMIVFCSVQARGFGLFLVTDHEIAHAWFPMLVGSDERRYPWMDEGLNTFMNHYSMIDFGGDPWPADPVLPRNSARLTRSEMSARSLMTPPDSISEDELGFLGYTKPGMLLYVLREYVLGPEVFDPAFQEYIDRWAYKHPQPADFFRTFEDVSGEDLAWFWRSWFLGNGYLDQAVSSVQSQGDTTVITITNRGDVVMPMELRLVYRDGTDECLRLPVDIWREGDTYTREVVSKKVRTVHVDPRGMLPDVNRSNNVWGRGVVTRVDKC